MLKSMVLSTVLSVVCLSSITFAKCDDGNFFLGIKEVSKRIKFKNGEKEESLRVKGACRDKILEIGGKTLNTENRGFFSFLYTPDMFNELIKDGKFRWKCDGNDEHTELKLHEHFLLSSNTHIQRIKQVQEDSESDDAVGHRSNYMIKVAIYISEPRPFFDNIVYYFEDYKGAK
eukprot:Pgem_evm1s8166